MWLEDIGPQVCPAQSEGCWTGAGLGGEGAPLPPLPPNPAGGGSVEGLAQRLRDATVKLSAAAKGEPVIFGEGFWLAFLIFFFMNK